MDEPNIVSDISWYSHSSPISHQKPMIFSHCQWNLHRFFWLNGHILGIPCENCFIANLFGGGFNLPLWKIWKFTWAYYSQYMEKYGKSWNSCSKPLFPATVFPSKIVLKSPSEFPRTIRGSASSRYPSLECQVMTPHIAPGVFWNLSGLEQGGYHGRSWHNPMESHHFQRAFSIANCWFTGG